MMDFFQSQNPSSQGSNRFERAIRAAKFVLMSMGIISTIVLLKVAIIPHTFDLVFSTFSRLWVFARSWLSPPFVYIIANFIIITIAASSNFHHKSLHFSDSAALSASASDSDPKHTTITDDAVPDSATQPSQPENQRYEPKEEEKDVEDSGLACNKSFTDPSPEKCLNTLEGTWRSIMEGQGKTITPQLKKSVAWITKAEAFQENENGEGEVAWAQSQSQSQSQRDTFNNTASLSLRLTREKSMSPEELNRRTEAFIHKFNNQIKLQRLESFQRFMEMINRGV